MCGVGSNGQKSSGKVGLRLYLAGSVTVME